MKKIVMALVVLVLLLINPSEAKASDSYTDSITYVTCIGEITEIHNMTPVKIDDSNINYCCYGYEVTMFDELDGNIYDFWMFPTDSIYDAVHHSLESHDLVEVIFSAEDINNPETYYIESMRVVGTTLYGGIKYQGYTPFGIIQQ